MTKFEFSNFQLFDTPLVYKNISYPTVEHFYCAMKTTDFTIRAKIASLPHPGAAKKYARAIPLRENWDSLKLSAMEFALNYKFAKGTTHLEKLKAFEGEIVEYNYWHDNYWGSCLCPRCNDKGENMLGKLLMIIRNREVIRLDQGTT